MAQQMADPMDPAMADLNPFVTALMTDMYQISMTYSYWKQKRHELPCCFDLFFRKNPFKGGYTVFGGLEEVLLFVSSFSYSETDILYLKTLMDYAPEEFFTFLAGLDCSEVTVSAVDDGSIAFPRLPMIRVEGPLAICQLLETTFLTLTNYPSLMATNASRFKLAAPGKILLEFGLRRAQGPDGGMSASKYAYLGGFNGTSHVLAGKRYNIPVSGTIAHSYICSFTSLDDIFLKKLVKVNGTSVDFVELVLKWRDELLSPEKKTHEGELAAFISYAIARPTGFLALIDTYDTLKCGNINFFACVLALDECGYKAIGIRLDSGDLAALSIGVRDYWKAQAKKYNKDWMAKMNIFASDGINETKLKAFGDHQIDGFGIGTNLVTCQAQPALGCVFKLVEINSKPCIKLSANIAKVTLPSKKDTYRFYASDGKPICDVFLNASEKAPEPNTVFQAYTPFIMPTEQKTTDITPAKVETMLSKYWGKSDGNKAKMLKEIPTLSKRRTNVLEGLKLFGPNYATIEEPQVYPTYVSGKLYKILHDLWKNAKVS